MYEEQMSTGPDAGTPLPTVAGKSGEEQQPLRICHCCYASSVLKVLLRHLSVVYTTNTNKTKPLNGALAYQTPLENNHKCGDHLCSVRVYLLHCCCFLCYDFFFSFSFGGSPQDVTV